MHPKIKNRPVGTPRTAGNVKPLLLHDVTNQLGSANSFARRRAMIASSAAATPNHLRHHVSRASQA